MLDGELHTEPIGQTDDAVLPAAQYSPPAHGVSCVGVLQ
jgi:hypothetical protein